MFKYQTIFILLFVLGVATCVIAYLSDQLGMKLGKKRISLLGLRPRQTATALSMASSLAVMIVTMLVLLAINPSLRKGLLYYDEARRENARLGLRNSQLKAQSGQQQDAIDRQTQTNQNLEKSLRDKNLRLAGLNNRVTEKQNQVNAAQQKLNAAQRNLQSAQSERESAQSARDAAQSARDAAQAAQNRAQAGQQQARIGETQARQGEAQARTGFAAAQSRYQQAQSRLVQAQQQEKIAQQQEKIAQQGVTKARAQLSDARAELSSTRLELKKTQLKANKDVVNSYRRVAEASRQKADLDVKISQQEKLLAEYKRQVDIYGRKLSFAGGLLSGDIKVAVASGQVFSSATIPPNADESSCLTVLRSLMARANDIARQNGYNALHLESVPIQQGDQIIELTEEQSLTLTASLLTNQPTPLSIRIIAARDHSEYSSEDEPEIFARIKAVVVRPVFASGEVVAKTTIMGGKNDAQGDAQVFNQLLSLLDEGQKTATDRHISAIPTAAEPNFYASDTRLSIFQALRQIQQKGGEVPVRLVAASAISTIEPVRIRIEVGDDSTAPSVATSSATPDVTSNENSGAA